MGKLLDRLSKDFLLGKLKGEAEKPLEEASSLPPGIYTSEEILNLEQRQIFAKGWLCPGLAADIPKPGDYLTYSIAEQPVFVMRCTDGEIRTFSNVCRHRMMQLLEGRGSCKQVVCPYHAWTYNREGQLIGAPDMKRSKGFDKKDIKLPEIRTEIWHGWIYITLNDDALLLEQSLSELDKLVSRYKMAGYIPVAQQNHVWDTNWKLLTENFMEGYHLPVAHRNTVGAWFPTEATIFPDETFETFTYQTFEKTGDAVYGRAHDDNQVLEGKWRHTSVMPSVFPCHMYVLAPDHFWYLSLRPRGVGQVDIRFGLALAPEVMAALDDKDKFIEETLDFFDIVNSEDRTVVEGIYRGAKGPLTEPGRLCWLEREVHDFMRYLSQALNG